MPGSYDITQGINGFQEYEGSLREEYIDGELRMFRTYVGPSETRRTFLIYMFGLTIVKDVEEGDVSHCRCLCAIPRPYPMPIATCQTTAVIPEVVLMPYGYRISPQDSGYANSIGTISGVVNHPQISCLVLIEIEYRQYLTEWPDSLHDPDFEESGFKDVPDIDSPRYFSYSAEPSIESKELESRYFGIASLGTIFPAVPAGPGGNSQLPVDNVHPIANISVNEFTVTVFNCPFVNRETIDAAHGLVNDRVWFGYPVSAVLFADYKVTPRSTMVGTFVYDIEFKFLAKTVPANGEIAGDVTPAMTNYVYKNRVGAFNRVRWNFPITATQQYWWPIMDIEHAVFAGVNVAGDKQYQPYIEADFMTIFEATTVPECSVILGTTC